MNGLTNTGLLQKRVKVNDCGSLGRENVISFYVKNYKENLLKLANDQSKNLEKQENKDIAGE